MTARKIIALPLWLSIATISNAPLHAQTGWGIGVINGEIYCSDLGRGQVIRLDRDGKKHVLLDDIHCHNLAPGFDGFIYAEAVGTNRGGMGDIVAIWRVSPDGQSEYAMPPTSRPVPGVWIARDSAGNSYGWHAEGERVSQILRRTPEGSTSVLAGSAWGFADGAGDTARFSHVGNLAVTMDGTVYLTDGGHLRRIETDATVTTLARDIVSSETGGLPGDFGLFNRSQGVAVATVDGQECVFIVDHYNQRVVRWTALDGAEDLHTTSNWLSRLTNGGLGWFVRGVAASGHDVHILEAFSAPGFVSALIGTPRIHRVPSAVRP